MDGADDLAVGLSDAGNIGAVSAILGLVDRDLTLPGAGVRSFWLAGAAWQFPDDKNADTMIITMIIGSTTAG